MPVETIGSCPICEADLAPGDVVHREPDGAGCLAECGLCGHVVRPA